MRMRKVFFYCNDYEEIDFNLVFFNGKCYRFLFFRLCDCFLFEDVFELNLRVFLKIFLLFNFNFYVFLLLFF